MTDVFVVGAGMTRFGKHPEARVRALASEAIASALASADIVVAEDNDLTLVAQPGLPSYPSSTRNSQIRLGRGRRLVRGRASHRMQADSLAQMRPPWPLSWNVPRLEK